MYQSIFQERRKGNPDRGYIYLRDDVQGWKRFKYQPPVYQLDDDGDYTTLFGKKCSKIDGKYDWFDNQILEKDIQKEIAVLRDFYYKTDDQPTYHNKVYLDIEIQLLGSLTPSYIQAAPAELTSLALTYYENKASENFRIYLYGKNVENRNFENKWVFYHEEVFDIENYIYGLFKDLM